VARARASSATALPGSPWHLAHLARHGARSMSVNTFVAVAKARSALHLEQRRGFSSFDAALEASPAMHSQPAADAFASSGCGFADAQLNQTRDPSQTEPRGKTVVTLDLANPANTFSALGYAPARDPLRVWPDVYDPDMDSSAWATAFDWTNPRLGYQRGIHSDCGFEPFTFNYAFDKLAHAVPSHSDGCDVSFGF
jgi:hypothetical protein